MGVSVIVLNAEDERPDEYDLSETTRAVPLVISSTNSFCVIVRVESIHPRFFLLVVVPVDCMYIMFISCLMEHGMALSGFCIGWLLRNGRVQLCVNGAPLSPLVSLFLVYGCLCLVSGLGAVCYHILFPLSSFFSLQSKIGGCDYFEF